MGKRLTLSSDFGNVSATKYTQAHHAAHFADMIKGIREHHPNAISFINPPIFKEPPQLSQELTLGRVALSAHFYDGLTMLGKRELTYCRCRECWKADVAGRHLFNAVSIDFVRS